MLAQEQVAQICKFKFCIKKLLSIKEFKHWNNIQMNERKGKTNVSRQSLISLNYMIW